MFERDSRSAEYWSPVHCFGICCDCLCHGVLFLIPVDSLLLADKTSLPISPDNQTSFPL